jgi:serine/threonine protein phosphatase PrpC
MDTVFEVPINVAVASVKGSSHQQTGSPNQDAFAYHVSKDLFVVAVADGLGSKPHSDTGARRAASLAVMLVAEYLIADRSSLLQLSRLETLKLRLLNTWRVSLGDQHEAYASTLLFVACTPTRCIIGQLGDGLILVVPKDNVMGTMPFHKTEADFSNFTDSLSDTRAAYRFKIREIESPTEDMFTGFLLMTDGVSGDMKDCGAFTSGILSRLDQEGRKHWSATLESLLAAWPVPANGDDKTLLLVTFGNREKVHSISQGESLIERGSPEEQIAHTPDSFGR